MDCYEKLKNNSAVKRVERECQMLLRAPRMEKIAWDFFRRQGVNFRYQFQYGKYCLDFFFPWKNRIVEIDGSSHDNPEQTEKDKKRDEYFKKQGIETHRVKNVSEKSLQGLCDL